MATQITSYDPFIAQTEQALLLALDTWERTPSAEHQAQIERIALRLLVASDDFAAFRARYRQVLRRYGGVSPRISFARTTRARGPRS